MTKSEKPLEKEPMKECCGCEMSCNYRQLASCPAFFKILEIAIGVLIIVLAITTLISEYQVHSNFKGLAHFLAFYILVSLCLIMSIILLTCYIAVNESPKNKRLKNFVKLCDMTAGIVMLVAFIIYVYITIKLEVDHYNEDSSKELPILSEMIATIVFTFIDAVIYLIGVCLK